MSGAPAGIRVVDFGQYLAGPLTAMMLADQAADVIRVDRPGGPSLRGHANAVLQRGKRSIVLDLRENPSQRGGGRSSALRPRPFDLAQGSLRTGFAMRRERGGGHLEDVFP